MAAPEENNRIDGRLLRLLKRTEIRFRADANTVTHLPSVHRIDRSMKNAVLHFRLRYDERGMAVGCLIRQAQGDLFARTLALRNSAKWSLLHASNRRSEEIFS